ncbi:MAG: hypothetical protein E7Z90_05895 [Cyanobacteria bacterium SIG29]|nr:hypothetical protein [Cyanobacteria bacterium SIG29]
MQMKPLAGLVRPQTKPIPGPKNPPIMAGKIVPPPFKPTTKPPFTTAGVLTAPPKSKIEKLISEILEKKKIKNGVMAGGLIALALTAGALIKKVIDKKIGK